jgi:hypothetical protein
VEDLKALEGYSFCGHGALMGRYTNDWQDSDYVLRCFGQRTGLARRRYREFVRQGAGEGKRSELVGGGLVRSLGGWRAVKVLRGAGHRVKGDERILGDGEFVEGVLEAANERLDRRSWLQRKGYNFNRLVERVAGLFEIPISEVVRTGKFARTVEARSVLCYWANRELGMRVVELARRLKLAQPTVTQSVARGEKIVSEKGLKIEESK